MHCVGSQIVYIEDDVREAASVCGYGITDLMDLGPVLEGRSYIPSTVELVRGAFRHFETYKTLLPTLGWCEQHCQDGKILPTLRKTLVYLESIPVLQEDLDEFKPLAQTPDRELPTVNPHTQACNRMDHAVPFNPNNFLCYRVQACDPDSGLPHTDPVSANPALTVGMLRWMRHGDVLQCCHVVSEETVLWSCFQLLRKKRDWAYLRHLWKVRSITLYWLDLTQHLMQEGQPGRKRDREEFESEFL